VTRAVRGAIGIEANDPAQIHEGALELVREILERNGIGRQDIISIIFSLTRDLTGGNPATGVRSAGFVDTPLFCVQEAYVEGSPPRMIRVLLTYSTTEQRQPTPVYLGRAAGLRPDLSVHMEDEER
jgi:chorismate mutase